MFCGTAENRREDQIPEDSKKIENYFYGLSDKVGEGNFSQVFKGVDQNTGMNVAVKVVKLNSLTTKIAQQLLKNEVSILKQLNHENVIRCLDVFQSKNNCYIVTEYYGGGDLEKMIFNNKFFHEKDIARIVYELYKGLLYLNQRNIIHRDFKPANIFMSDTGIPKIADFGFAVKYNRPFKDISIGSPIYMSPEGLLLHEYGPKTDVWALGVTIYEMLHGQTPLSRCRDEKQLKQKVLLPPVFRQGISQQLRRLVDLCLTVDPKHRIEMKEIANTPYMKKLIQQNQKINKDLTCTYHTNSSLTKNALQFVKQIKTYEQGLALLQYCRLLHKTSQETPSLVFSQWLLNLCWNLTSIKIQAGDKESNQVLMTTIHNYFIKYQKQHTDSRIDVTCQEVVGECKKLLNKIQSSINSSVFKNKQNNLMMLLRETQMLQKFGQSNKLYAYSKATQVQKYLDSLKSAKGQTTAMNSTQFNQFTFNK